MFSKKVVLLRLLYKHIADEAIQKTYQNLLSENFLQLPTDAIYDLVFSKWISPTSEAAEELLKGILKMNEERPHGVYSFPDPVESTLECAYLMYINGIIKDISILKELAEGIPHLQFLLDQETFDYTQVDFSNYMWENFMRHKKYMECFIAHKDTIVPLIKARIVRKEVSKAEEKILYGVLLDKDELWDA